MTQFTGQHATVWMTSQTPVAFTNEAMTDAGDHKTYTITNTVKRYWDRAATFTVQSSTNGGSTWNTESPSGYTIQHVGGKVFMTNAIGGTALLRVSGNYLPVAQIGEAHNWSWSVSRDVQKDTTFGSGWQTKVPVVGEVSAKLSRWWLDGLYLNQLNSTSPIVLVLFEDDTVAPIGARWEAFAFLKGDSVKSASDALIDEDLDFEIDGKPFWLAA